MKPSAVIFNIDGVLAKKSPERDYRDYDKVYLDSPIKQSFILLDFYFNKYLWTDGKKAKDKIIFLTDRKELCREKTESWLGRYYNAVHKPKNFSECLSSCSDPISYHFGKNYLLFMRDDKDHRPAHILKKEIYDNHIKDKYDVVAVFEDDEENCKMFKELGLFVFQVMTKD